MCATVSAALLIALTFSHPLSPAARAQQRGLTAGTVTAPQPVTRSYALIIGNNNYTSLLKLKTAEGDAREIERLLRDTYGFQTQLLLNATRAQIVAALSAYRRDLLPDANLLIYYAGHGYDDKDAGKAYWLPVDAKLEDSANWIIADEITAAIRVIPARHVLVISDSCYAGALTRGIGELLPPPTEREQFLQHMAAGHSRTLMASGGDEPVADNGGSGHSVFATALLRGLREMDKPQFTAAELFHGYVEQSVAGRANQTPEYDPLRNSGHDSGDFVFVKSGLPSPSSKVGIEIWWPRANASVSGAQPFKVMATNLPLAQYTAYWQVDGGELNVMADSAREYPHKEALVDLSRWSWRGKGPYNVNFVVKDLSGTWHRNKLPVSPLPTSSFSHHWWRR